MRYELHGIVASPETAEDLARRFRHARPSLLDGAELALVPLGTELATEMDLPGFPVGAVDPESGFDRLTSGVAAVITAESRRGPVAYLEADYTGDVGAQVAAVWLDCHVVYGPRMLLPGEPFPVASGSFDEAAPIAEALRYLGVQAIGRRDEFVVLGLGRHRSTDAWYAAAGVPG